MTRLIFRVITVGWVFAAVAAKFQAIQRSIPRKSFVKVSESAAEDMHELVFAVQQRNLLKFDKMLLERSTPGNSLYQQWLTFEEVGEITSNPQGASAVKKWLTEHGITASWESAHQDYIKASAPISKWEELLDTKFYQWVDHSRSVNVGSNRRFIHRAEEYSLPKEVRPHLSAVFNTVQVPPVFQQKHRRLKSSKEGSSPGSNDAAASAHGTVNVQFLNELYNITSNHGNVSMNQSVFETSEEYFSPTDLALFQEYNNLSVHPADAPFGYSTNDCITNDCYEGNLDVQYIMGIAQQTSTIYWYIGEDDDTDTFVAWVTAVADAADPPLVNSVSWGSIEQTCSVDTMDAFNVEAMKLSAMGRTIIVSSGDNGPAGASDLCNFDSSSAAYGDWTGTPWYGEGYFPSFPATSPYVTAVGATMGPENGAVEIACQSQLGGVITTGGGFSTLNPTPSWQQNAVKAYFNGLSAVDTPSNGYNPNGRAYPDVSLIGVWYEVIVQGKVAPLFGTSASAPVFAAFISLANAARARSGLSPLGFLNPTIYAYGSSNPFFNDVTSGYSHCTAWFSSSDKGGATCCESGFYATTGWDPLTGFGSINYSSIEPMFRNITPFVVDVDDITRAHDDDDFDDDLGGMLIDDNASMSTGASIGVAIGVLGGLSLLCIAVFIAKNGAKSKGRRGEAASAETTDITVEVVEIAACAGTPVMPPWQIERL